MKIIEEHCVLLLSKRIHGKHFSTASLKKAHDVSITYFKSFLWDLVLTLLQDIYMSMCRWS